MIRSTISIALALFAGLALPSFAEDVAEGRSYGYFSALEGNASLIGNDGARAEAEVNLPILPGDQLSLTSSGRAELFLPDASLIRVDGGSSLSFDRIAWSAGVEDLETSIWLSRGELLLSLPSDGAPTDLRLDQGAVYLDPNGIYRIIAENGRSRVLVRQGRAEITTSRGSTIVLEDEEAIITGNQSPRVSISAAAPRDGLERWAAYREGENQWDGSDRVDARLRYAAAPLDRYGTWFDVGGTSAWRPVHVGADWSPYTNGRWLRTSIGLTWVSADPWGPVPYSYGSWDWVDRWGWVWYPGHRWAPAHVTWYWGPRYAGWCPTGWYNGYGRSQHVSVNINLNFGVFGWAGGRVRDWDRWHFVDYDGLDDRRLARHTRTAHALAESGVTELGRGLLTTDSRPVAGVHQLDGASARSAWDRELRSAGRQPDQLPDVTALAVRPRQLDVASRNALDKPVRLGSDPTARPVASTGGRARAAVRSNPGVDKPALPGAAAGRPTVGATRSRVAVPDEGSARPGRVAPRPSERTTSDRPTVVPSRVRPRTSGSSDTTTNDDDTRSTVRTERNSTPRSATPRSIEAPARRPLVEPRTRTTPAGTESTRPTVRSAPEARSTPTTRPTPTTRSTQPTRSTPAPRVYQESEQRRRPTAVAPRSGGSDSSASPQRDAPVRRVIESRRPTVGRSAPSSTAPPSSRTPAPTASPRSSRSNSGGTPRATSPPPAPAPAPKAEAPSRSRPTEARSDNSGSSRRGSGSTARSRSRRDRDDD